MCLVIAVLHAEHAEAQFAAGLEWVAYRYESAASGAGTSSARLRPVLPPASTLRLELGGRGAWRVGVAASAAAADLELRDGTATVTSDVGLLDFYEFQLEVARRLVRLDGGGTLRGTVAPLLAIWDEADGARTVLGAQLGVELELPITKWTRLALRGTVAVHGQPLPPSLTEAGFEAESLLTRAGLGAGLRFMFGR